MINSLYIYRSDNTNPFENLAREQVILEYGPSDGVVLYLWQNEKTVVIGRNQNAFKECYVSLLEEEGGHLARRLSGGGAVFHDSGNLNFTFILPREDFDTFRQLEVVCRTCRSFNIPAVISGRNDLEVNGRKFSGSAFYKSGERAYHHGTLLLNSDITLIARYLNPPTAKLKAKGVDSVRSRVVNLCSVAPDLTREDMCKELICAAENVYGFNAQEMHFTDFMDNEVNKLTEHYASKKWRFGSNTSATFSCEETFLWGTVAMEFNVKCGIITNIEVFTDAMNWELSGKIKNAVKGQAFSRTAIVNSLNSAEIERGVLDDLCLMVNKQEM